MRNCSHHVAAQSAPSAFITKGKQRLKQHNNNTVYLESGDEFQVELFNPTDGKVLARIDIDGHSIGSGIVLRPGERVYLERFLDKAKKFMFDTYVVNGESKAAMKAIENNGVVLVQFFKQTFERNTYYQYSQPLFGNGTASGRFANRTTTNMPISTFTATTWDKDVIANSTTTSFSGAGNSTPTRGIDLNYLGTTTTYASMDAAITTQELDTAYNTSHEQISTRSRSLKKSKAVETGRIEEGSDSNQKFDYDNSTFSMFATWISKWQLLPVSRKEIVAEDIKVYCTSCGTKRKKDTYRFCPQCGTQY